VTDYRRNAQGQREMADPGPTNRQVLAVKSLIFYEGPFLRAAAWLWKLPDNDAYDESEPEVPPVGRIRDGLANVCASLDDRWRKHYLDKGVFPPERWRK
jgi:hypothetical protein